MILLKEYTRRTKRGYKIGSCVLLLVVVVVEEKSDQRQSIKRASLKEILS